MRATAPLAPASVPKWTRKRGKRSRLGAQSSTAGEFVTMVEIVPPKGIDIARRLRVAKFVK